MKFPRLIKKLNVEVETANRSASDAGLQGRTIAPKNNPKIREVVTGFFKTGALYFGRRVEKSKLKIRNKLMIAKMPKAIGEIIPIASVKDFFNMNEKINPTRNIERITPAVIIQANFVILTFLSVDVEDR